jgi:hypothetical protein
VKKERGEKLSRSLSALCLIGWSGFEREEGKNNQVRERKKRLRREKLGSSLLSNRFGSLDLFATLFSSSSLSPCSCPRKRSRSR